MAITMWLLEEFKAHPCGAAGAQPHSVQGLLVGLFEAEGHRSQEVPSESPLTFLSLQVSSKPEVESPQAEGGCQGEQLYE